MKSIPTLVVRDDRGRAVLPVVIEPECSWAMEGEGVATLKIDGTCCAVIGGVFYKRHRHRAELGAPPKGWTHHDGHGDSGHGWLPVGDGPEDRWHREAFTPGLEDGTYELVGPKVQQNRYGLERHQLWRHGARKPIELPPHDPEKLRDYMEHLGHEGIVWHHPDGRMAKLKCRDFGLHWRLSRDEKETR